jgi:transcriptional regulator of NAD metabolism
MQKSIFADLIKPLRINEEIKITQDKEYTLINNMTSHYLWDEHVLLQEATHVNKSKNNLITAFDMESLSTKCKILNKS